MPFIVDSNMILFCRGVLVGNPAYRAWRLHVRQDGEERRIDTGFGPSVVECSPAAWHDGANWHLTFIAGGDLLTKDKLRFWLYEMTGPTFDTLSSPKPIQPTAAGYVRDGTIVTCSYTPEVDTIHIAGPKPIRITAKGYHILRIIYRADRPKTLLITCQRDDWFGTFAHDLDRREWVRVTTGEDEDVYKCSIYGNQMAHAVKVGEGFEDRGVDCSSWRSELLTREPMMVEALLQTIGGNGHALVPSNDVAELLAECRSCEQYVADGAWGFCRAMECPGCFVHSLRGRRFPQGCLHGGRSTRG